MSRPPLLATIPKSIDEVDAAWLTEVLRGSAASTGGDSVTEVRAERIALETGFSSELYRVHLSGRGQLPASVIVKLPTTTVVRDAMDLVGGYARELTFYRDLAADAPIRAPQVHASVMAPDSTDFVLVLEDLSEWENEDHYVGLPLARAQLCLGELARLHAWSDDPALADRLSVFPSLGDAVTRQVFPTLFAEGWAVYRTHARNEIPPHIADFAANFGSHLERLLDVVAERDGLIHGDIRADNLFFRGDEMAVVDFQLAARGSPLADVGYLLSQGLTTLQRAGQDERLVREYLTAFTAAGGAEYAWDDAWRQYRAGVAFYLVFPVIAIRGWDGLPPNARELCLRLIERSIATILDVDALGVLT